MKWLLAAAAALPLAAQIQVFVLQPSGAQLAGSSVNLGTFPTNEPSEIRFRATNSSSAEQSLQNFSANGTGFSMAAPFQPTVLAAGASFEFGIRFSPTGEGSYSGSLTVNTFSTLLRAAAAPGPGVAITTGGETNELTGGLQANVAAGQSLTFELSLFNPHPRTIAVEAFGLTGDGFELLDAPALPLSLAPGGRFPFRIRFSGAEEREYASVLTAGLRRLQLRVVVFRPKLSVPRIVPDTAALVNGRQIGIKLVFADPAMAAGGGQLRVAFTGAVPDPAVQFINGSREISFTVAAGSREATFDGENAAILQTGTTAGAIRLQAETESGVAVETYPLLPAAIAVDSASGARSGSNLEIAIAGFDNTRTAGSMNFRFFDRGGAPIGGIHSIDFASNFRTYFSQSTMGGVFRLRAVFPVTGNAADVGSVLVEIANSVGRTDVQRISFP